MRDSIHLLSISFENQIHDEQEKNHNGEFQHFDKVNENRDQSDRVEAIRRTPSSSMQRILGKQFEGIFKLDGRICSTFGIGQIGEQERSHDGVRGLLVKDFNSGEITHAVVRPSKHFVFDD